MQIDYNLCSRYEYTTKFDSEGKEEDYKSGECVGKHKIDNLDTQGIGQSIVLNFTLWERKTKDSIWRIANMEQGQTMLSLTKEQEKSAFGLDKHGTYFLPQLSLQSMTLISYTNRF